MSVPDRVEWARELATRLLRPLGRRLDHVIAVGDLAVEVSPVLPAVDRERLISAAYLHDVGYSPHLASTGFHPLDGARFLRESGHNDLAILVAHHSGARREAGLRGLTAHEAEFPFADSLVDKALTYCDLTTSPSGTRVELADRIAEILRRYGADHVVAKSILAGRTEFELAVAEIERLAANAGVVLTGSLGSTR
jgi:hypothetical protein